jgi:hypothetical protein
MEGSVAMAYLKVGLHSQHFHPRCLVDGEGPYKFYATLTLSLFPLIAGFCCES